MIILALTEFVSVLYFAIKAGSKRAYISEKLVLFMTFAAHLTNDVRLKVTAEIIDVVSFV